MPSLPESHRPQPAKRSDRAQRQKSLYNTRYWRDRLTQRILHRDPLCIIALVCVEQDGMPAPSTQVDHRLPIQDGGDESDENLRGACQRCHSRKTRLERLGLWDTANDRPRG